eukprot:CAMPEP_0178432120 /NCGR_PEP_ID=MMETSP0689_2-20121128/32214_1 /TAXON_ID=160604 /ORGANISM="Amphidinium massartii, Strain CS-259" /LENGTH=104 /DNA_ID=CAMNT_0020054083 /DNA_START=179 /DNA_END=493 /DNA_ORIENTATION=-
MKKQQSAGSVPKAPETQSCTMELQHQARSKLLSRVQELEALATTQMQLLSDIEAPAAPSTLEVVGANQESLPPRIEALEQSLQHRTAAIKKLRAKLKAAMKKQR